MIKNRIIREVVKGGVYGVWLKIEKKGEKKEKGFFEERCASGGFVHVCRCVTDKRNGQGKTKQNNNKNKKGLKTLLH